MCIGESLDANGDADDSNDEHGDSEIHFPFDFGYDECSKDGGEYFH